MKKLKNKVFSVVFLIMTLITVAVIAAYNVQLYNQEERSVERGLSQSMFEKFDIFDNHSGKAPEDSQFGNLRFMDTTVYTAILGSDNSIQAIINHSDSEVTDEVTSFAESAAESGDDECKGNLYYTKYSYRKIDNMYITIVDNSNTNKILRTTLFISLLVLLLLEAAIFLISRRIAVWIAQPVAESFDKQKRFIADASHELKTPLSVIIASADALESNPEEKKWLENIKSESDRMNKLIADLLELAKSEEVNEAGAFSEGNLSKLVEKSALTFESVMFEKGITLNDIIGDNIMFNMNEAKIQQLVSILLDNAVKHSENGSAVLIELKQDKDIILSVTNAGEGIPKGEEEKIFERFYRADESRNRNENRYGLGLAIAKNIVTAHGGTITAKSENGYTTFKVIFKVK